MNRITFGASVLLGWATIISSSHAQLDVGATAQDVTITQFDSDGNLNNQNLYDSAGKVVVMFYYTPW